jgi:uncharacterized protein with GYD domain
MAKYLVHGAYTLDGVKGLVKEGGSSRKTKVTNNVESLGGKVESFYFAFGGDDFYTIIDLPDNISAAALSLAASAGGGLRSNVVVLMSPEEIDQATKKVAQAAYTPPGR